MNFPKVTPVEEKPHPGPLLGGEDGMRPKKHRQPAKKTGLPMLYREDYSCLTFFVTAAAACTAADVSIS